jgi:KaiC/GvpD/RAD55 family RecA-like ATPase
MDYHLGIEGAPDSVPGGTAILLLHPSTAATDRIDTEFLKTDTDHLLVVSTRTTAREVLQKLDHYGVADPDRDPDRAHVLDTLSVERGLSRRRTDHVHYVNAPDDVEGILAKTEEFLASHEGRRRVSFDSVTELAYYADEDRAVEALERMADLLSEYDAVGLFHADAEVHDEATIRRFRERCSGVVELAADGTVTSDF